MTKRGELTRWDPTPVICNPTRPGDECHRCGRLRLGQEPCGKTVVIDAMTLKREQCPMWLPRAQ